MTTTDLREALHEVGASTTAPPVDRLAFERRVRAQRRYRTGRRVVVAGVAAAAVAAAALVVPQVVEGDGRAVEPAAPSPSGLGLGVRLDGPVAFISDGHLRAVEPSGWQHDFDGRYQEVIGATPEDIWVIDAESHLARWHASPTDGGRGAYEFDPADVPYDGPVQSAQVSADGRWVAWVDLEEKVTVADLEAGTTETWDPGSRQSSYLVDVASGSGAALVAVGGRLVLHTEERDLDVPSGTSAAPWQGSAAPTRVAVVVDGTGTAVHDVAGGATEPVVEVPGAGPLSPSGDFVVTLAEGADDTAGVRVWSASRGVELLDVPGRPYQVGWADDDTALVVSFDQDGTVVYACEAASVGPCAPIAGPDALDAVTLAR